jgi:hypothetical protein
MLIKGAVGFYKTVLEVPVVGLSATPAVTRNHLQNIRNLCGKTVSLQGLGRVVGVGGKLFPSSSFLTYKGLDLDLLNRILGIVRLKVDRLCRLSPCVV